MPIDLRTTRLADVLQGSIDFTSPVFIAWEGMSMYFEEPEVRAMLAGMAPLLRNNRSRLWLDVIDRRAVFEPDIFPEVKAFMTGMQMLGEPFVFGVCSAKEFMESNGFRCHKVESSDVFLGAKSDPVYSIYHFCTASADVGPIPGHPLAGGDQASWTTHPAHAAIPAASNPANAPIGNIVQK